MKNARSLKTRISQAAIVLTLAALLGSMSLLVTAAAGQPDTPDTEGATSTWLARADAGMQAGDVTRSLRGQGIATYRYYPALDVWAITMPERSATEMQDALRDNGTFEWITPNPRVVAAGMPDDPYLASQQWNMPMIEAPAAWDITTGSSDIVIAVIDTGISLDHPDLATRIWVNEDEIANNGLDDDANGFIDDYHGWNFYAEEPDADDDHGHGTHVAGIAGAATDNGVGVAGVSWHSSLMPIKFLNSAGKGDFLPMLQGMQYAVDNGARVLNLSVTVEGDLTSEQQRLLDERVAYATAHDVLVVAASGNQGRSTISYPSAHPDIVSVGATTNRDELWYSSNRGEGLDLVAPGVNIYSTYYNWYGATYSSLNGTSMATPHVAGAATLLWSVNPGYSPAEIAQILRVTTDDVNGDLYPGVDLWMGWGRLNLRRAVQAATTGQALRLEPARPAYRVLEEPLIITATLTTELGEPVPDGTLVAFSNDMGALSEITIATTDGVATTQFDDVTTPGSATVIASAGAVSETLVIDILPGAPQNVQIRTQPETIITGSDSVTITVDVADGVFNPVSDGTALEFDVTGGHISPSRAITFGGETTTYFTPPQTTGDVTLGVLVDSTLSVTHTLSVQPAAADNMILSMPIDWMWAGEASIPITVTILDTFGNPVTDGQSVSLQTTAGVITPTVGLTQSGVVTGTLAGDLPRGRVCITADLDDLSESRWLSVFAQSAWLPGLVAGTSQP